MKINAMRMRGKKILYMDMQGFLLVLFHQNLMWPSFIQDPPGTSTRRALTPEHTLGGLGWFPVVKNCMIPVGFCISAGYSSGLLIKESQASPCRRC